MQGGTSGNIEFLMLGMFELPRRERERMGALRYMLVETDRQT